MLANYYLHIAVDRLNARAQHVFVSLFQIQRHNIMMRDVKIQVTYYSNVYAENIIVKTYQFTTACKDDIHQLADLRQQISQKMILLVQHIA